MADPLTTSIRLTKPTVGGDSGNWGGLLNGDMDFIDQAINQTVTVSVADANYSLIADGSASDQARYAVYNITGAWTADRTITLPANAKLGLVTNGTSGGHNVILSAGGTALYVPPGATFRFTCDGTNVTPLGPQQWTQTASSASSLAVPLFSQFAWFRMHLLGLIVGTAAASIRMQFSDDGGSTYKATNYAYNFTTAVSNVVSTTSTIADTSIPLSPSLVGSGPGWTAHYDIYPGAAGLRSAVGGKGFGVRSDSSYETLDLGATWDSTAERLNYAQLFASSGTLSGPVRMEAYP